MNYIYFGSILLYILVGILMGSGVVERYPVTPFLKALPVLSLAFFMVYRVRNLKGWLMGIGFVFAAAGDALLAVDRNALFVFALTAFLIAHLLYTAVFIRKPRFDRQRLAITAGIAAFGVFISIAYYPRLGPLMIPVLAYTAVICMMGVAAFLGSQNHQFIRIGALLFVYSDAALGFAKFYRSVIVGGDQTSIATWLARIAVVLVLPSYWAAQYLFARGILQVKKTILI